MHVSNGLHGCSYALFLAFFAMSTGCSAPEDDAADEGETAGELTTGMRHVTLGTPTDDSPQDEGLLVHPQYVTSHNRFRNGPNWASWVVTKTDYGNVPRREEDFLTDDLLPADVYHVTHVDYAGSGWNRGHLVRSEERTDTVANNTATFLMTNVLPQRYEMNIGPWLKFEGYCKRLVLEEGRDLAIIAGGIFADSCKTDRTAEGSYPTAQCKTIGKPDAPQEKRVAVPDKFWKIVVQLPRGRRLSGVTADTRVTAIILDNEDEHIFEKNWVDYLTDVDTIEKLTGYDFLSKVEDSLEAKIESRVDRFATDVPAADAGASH